MSDLVNRLDLRRAAFFGQVWGGLIGLRVVAAAPDRFDRVVVSNTGLPAAGGLRGWLGYPLFKLAVWWEGAVTLEELRADTTFVRWVAYSHNVSWWHSRIRIRSRRAANGSSWSAFRLRET